VATGGEVRVNATTANDQYNPSVTALADGGWLVASDVGLRRIDPRAPKAAATAASGVQK